MMVSGGQSERRRLETVKARPRDIESHEAVCSIRLRLVPTLPTTMSSVAIAAAASPIASSSRSPVGSPASGVDSSDDDSYQDLSFEYKLDENGKLIRVSKGSQKSPNTPPPTPPKSLESPKDPPTEPPAPISVRRASLSRSGSLPGASSSATATSIALSIDSLLPPSTSRNLTRTSSNPVSLATPAQAIRSGTSSIAPSSSGLLGTGRRIGGAQRIRREDAERQRREVEERIALEEEEKERERARRAIEEKENAYIDQRQSPPSGSHSSSRQIASLPSRTNPLYGSSRVGRSIVPAKKLPSFGKITEHELEDVELNDVYQHDHHRSELEGRAALARSRSLPPHQVQFPASRPNSVYGTTSTRGARRVTIEERLRQEQEIADEKALGKSSSFAYGLIVTDTMQRL